MQKPGLFLRSVNPHGSLWVESTMTTLPRALTKAQRKPLPRQSRNANVSQKRVKTALSRRPHPQGWVGRMGEAQRRNVGFQRRRSNSVLLDSGINTTKKQADSPVRTGRLPLSKRRACAPSPRARSSLARTLGRSSLSSECWGGREKAPSTRPGWWGSSGSPWRLQWHRSGSKAASGGPPGSRRAGAWWRPWSPGDAGPWAHLHDTSTSPVNPVIFHVRLQGNVPKANIGTKDLSPALNKHLQKVYSRLTWKRLGIATNVTTLKYFLPVEELRILNTHHANILLYLPQSSTPDDVCCFLLVYRNLVSF